MKRIITQEDAIVHFIHKMDTEMIDAILDNGITYYGLKKEIFIDKLQIVFDTFFSKGNNLLNSFEGVCTNCSKGCKGFSFIGNKTNNYMDLLFEIKDGKITNIYECGSFKLNDEKIKKEGRIYLDEIIIDLSL
ncbi:MAG: hypothetical protein RL065_419 [Bacteroidota bacterium]|jgi:hypothetical protein